jgi:hypothetical protein
VEVTGKHWTAKMRSQLGIYAKRDKNKSNTRRLEYIFAPSVFRFCLMPTYVKVSGNEHT